MRMNSLFMALSKWLIVCSLLLTACGTSPDEPGKARTAASTLIDTTRVAVYETLKVTLRDTIVERRKIYDTVTVMISDTLYVTVVDTIRTIVVDDSTPINRDIRPASGLKETASTVQLEATHSLKNIPAFSTIRVDSLSSNQRVWLSDLTGMQKDEIRNVRWGPVLAPAGHPKHRATFYGALSDSAIVIAYVDSSGNTMGREVR
jgi:hypothetical protein